MYRALAGVVIALISAGAAAQEAVHAPDTPFRLHVGGGLALAGGAFTATRRFTEFAEPGRIRGDYSAQPGAAFEAGLEYRFGRRLGVAAAFGHAGRRGAVAYHAEIPHPLYLAKPRIVDATEKGLARGESAGHLDLVFRGRLGRLDYALLAGPSRISVKAEVLQPLRYSQSYPYDTLAVGGVPTETVHGASLGMNVGGLLDYRLGPRVGAGASARFSRARAKLPVASDASASVNLGGLDVSAALSFHF